MCLGIPGQVVEVNSEQGWAVIETMGLTKKVSTALIDAVVPGEYLLVHAGYAIEKIDIEEAEKTLALWEEIAVEEGTE